MPGDDIAEEMLVVLREINAKRRRIGAKDVMRGLARSCFSSNRPWRESTSRVHSGVDRLDADGTRVSGQEFHESTDPGLREKQHTFMERAPPEGARES